MQGKIKKLIRERGFGFITTTDGQDIFFHHSALVGADFKTLTEDTGVEFNLERGPKGHRASIVKIISAPDSREKRMLTVTPLALERMQQFIQSQTTEPGIGIRLLPSISASDQLEMTIDREYEGDQVLEIDGTGILFVHPELAATLEGMVIDCQETPDGIDFTLNEHSTDT